MNNKEGVTKCTFYDPANGGCFYFGSDKPSSAVDSVIPYTEIGIGYAKTKEVKVLNCGRNRWVVAQAQKKCDKYSQG